MQFNCLFLFLMLLVVNIDLSVGDPKRSFGFGRSRPKGNSNLSVRRRGHVQEAAPKTHSAPVQQKQAQPSHASHTPSAPQGPPPAYSAGPSAGKTNIHAAPPAYSAHGAAPPSYSASNSHAKYPQQGYSGVSSGTNLHQSSPGYGWNANAHNSYGGHQPHYGGYPSSGMPHYGGYPSGGMPNYGGYGGMMGGGMMGGGMMGGGSMMGGGMMGNSMGVQPIYMQQKKPSLLGGVAGYALTGLAGYQLARAFSGGSGSGYHSTQHIHHHYHDAESDRVSSTNENIQSKEPTLQAPVASQSPYSPSIPYNPDVPSVPLAPFPSEIASVSPQSNVNNHDELNVTPVPEIDNNEQFPYPTIHPSLFPYASPLPNKDLEYWAKSVDKKLNLTDTSNSQSTTTSP